MSTARPTEGARTAGRQAGATPVSNAPASAIVFAYHQVGVRCLRTVLDAGVCVPLVVTHADVPGERSWFDSVAEVAAEHGLRCVAPADPHTPELLAEALAAAPDFVFSFYYRRMLGPAWLALARRGAFNLHGSLLPRYRGRVPVNWAVLHGERETGATLHVMAPKPDSGAIVDQCAVPILRDDTAAEVFAKVVVAAEIVLSRSLPRLMTGTATLTPQRLAEGSYFGGRTPEDGQIPADASAARIHNFVRALAPPYPGAFLQVAGRRLVIERTQRSVAPASVPRDGLRVVANGSDLWLVAADGSTLKILRARFDGEPAPLSPGLVAQVLDGDNLSGM